MTKIKDIAYGYWWNCAACGAENAYGLTQAEADEYIKDWEADNADEAEEDKEMKQKKNYKKSGEEQNYSHCQS